jgi:hypothetical protein
VRQCSQLSEHDLGEIVNVIEIGFVDEVLDSEMEFLAQYWTFECEE